MTSISKMPKPKYTSIRLTLETAAKLRKLVGEMREAEPDNIHTTDDVVARLIDRQGYSAPAKVDSVIARWQNQLSEDVAKECLDIHARIGEHVVRATTELRQKFREESK